jgi:hypothetical protein
MSVEQVSGSAWAECPNGVESAPWTYYKRHNENIDAFFKALQERI